MMTVASLSWVLARPRQHGGPRAPQGLVSLPLDPHTHQAVLTIWSPVSFILPCRNLHRHLHALLITSSCSSHGMCGRRASISEGMEARMSTRRSSFAEAGRASLARRGSVAAEGRNSTYAGPRRASVDDSAVCDHHSARWLVHGWLGTSSDDMLYSWEPLSWYRGHVCSSLFSDMAPYSFLVLTADPGKGICACRQ